MKLIDVTYEQPTDVVSPAPPVRNRRKYCWRKRAGYEEQDRDEVKSPGGRLLRSLCRRNSGYVRTDWHVDCGSGGNGRSLASSCHCKRTVLP